MAKSVIDQLNQMLQFDIQRMTRPGTTPRQARYVREFRAPNGAPCVVAEIDGEEVTLEAIHGWERAQLPGDIRTEFLHHIARLATSEATA